MAVKKLASESSAQIQQFYRRNQHYSLFVAIALQVMLAFALGSALHFFDILSMYTATFWLLLTAFFVSGTGSSLVTLSIVSEPLKGISAALAHAAGEKSSMQLPNPNDAVFTHNGAKPLLQAIYLLNQSIEPESSKHSSTAAKLEESLARSHVGIVLLNKKGNVIYANSKAPVATGPGGKRNINANFRNGEGTDLHAWRQDCQKNTIHAEKSWARVRSTSSNDERFFDVVASYSKGAAAETTLFFIDRTELYASDEKDLDFIAFAAHELRGPITIIRGYIEVLHDELKVELTKNQDVLFGRLTISANRLTTYLNNILNVSRYDRNNYAIHPSKQSVFEIYDSIAKDMSGRASSQNRILQASFDPDLPYVAADPSSISEVFSNLIDNAIKYSSEGGIIEMYAETAGDFVEITVRDHGIGMPDSVVKNLFHKFYRSHRSRESVAGSGIGLYLSKAIVDSHGGTIKVSSNEKRGSTFTFSLPIYATVEEKLKTSDNKEAQTLANSGKKTWISNHNMYRG